MGNIFFAELQRSYLDFRRYWLEAVSQLFIVTVLFYLLLRGAQFIAGPLSGENSRLDIVIIGFISWTVALGLIGSIANTVQEEARTGTLEQLFLSTNNATLLFIMRGLVSTLFTITLNMLMLFLVLFITQRNLHFSFQMIWPFFILLAGSLGISLCMGGIALLVKRMQSFLSIFQFALLPVLMIPIEDFSGILRYLTSFIPLLPSVGVLRQILTGSTMNYSLLLFAIINSGLLLLIGIWLFRVAETRAKQQGLLSGH
jgi:ABC-2 type transport system permease protein